MEAGVGRLTASTERRRLARAAVAAAGRGTVDFAAARAPCARAGVAQLAERQPSKLHVAGSNPVSRSNPSFALRATR
jgi:hypothetical protein